MGGGEGEGVAQVVRGAGRVGGHVQAVEDHGLGRQHEGFRTVAAQQQGAVGSEPAQGGRGRVGRRCRVEDEVGAAVP